MSNAPVKIRLVLGAADLAESLNTSLRTIHRLNSSGRISRPSRLGGQLRWRLAEIDAWVAAGMPDRKRWEQLQPRASK